jgi:hypothetical protein
VEPQHAPQGRHGVAASGPEAGLRRNELPDGDAGGQRAVEPALRLAHDARGEVVLPVGDVVTVGDDAESGRRFDPHGVPDVERLHDGEDLVVAVGAPPQHLEEEVQFQGREDLDRVGHQS